MANVFEVLEKIPGVSLYLQWWKESPMHLLVETALVLVIIFILLKRPAKKAKTEQLPPGLVQELIDEYEPEPLCPPLNPVAEQILKDQIVLESKPKKYTKVQGVEKEVLNCSTMDFLGLGQRDEVKKAAEGALDKYGCGSCGPRGFYGSIDVHVYLEQDIAKFFGTQEAIVYSDASSTSSSAIPAFSNRADLLVVDDGVNDAILTGVNLARSKVYFFKHNDMEDLKRILMKVDQEDKALKRTPQRRFIVVEGLYRNFGDIAPLDQIMKFKNEYKWRLFLDESFSIGIYGANGRGVHEHFGFAATDCDVLVSSLSTTLSSVGGFCAGSREVVDHQRLSGSGYCFSASSPPFVSTAASAAIKILSSEAKSSLIPKLRKNAQYFASKIKELAQGWLVLESDPTSAIVHLRVDPKFQLCKERKDYDEQTRLSEDALLRAICKTSRERGFLMTTSNYITGMPSTKIGSSARPPLPPPSIRLAITCLHEESELEKLAQTLSAVAKETLQGVDYNKKDENAFASESPAAGLTKRR